MHADGVFVVGSSPHNPCVLLTSVVVVNSIAVVGEALKVTEMHGQLDT